MLLGVAFFANVFVAEPTVGCCVIERSAAVAVAVVVVVFVVESEVVVDATNG